MAIKMTRAEYEAKYGKKPIPATSTTPIKMTRAEYEAKYGKKPAVNNYQVDSPTANVPVIKQLSSFGLGVGSEIGKAGLGVGQTFLKGVGALGNVMSKGTSERYTDPLIKNIETIKQNVYQKPFEKQLGTTSGQIGKGVGMAIPYIAPSGSVTKAQGAITVAASKIPAVGNLAKFGKGALGVAGRAVPEAVSAGAVGLGVSGGDVERAKRDALIGAGTSAAFGTLGALGRGAKDTGLVKTVLSKTTGIPKTAFDAIDEKGLNKFATPEEALAKGRQSVVDLRAKNTKLWQDTVPKITEKYTGVRTALKQNQIKRLAQVVDEFGVDEKYLPQNLNNISALEAMNLMKGLNELDSLSVKMSPKGAVVRNLRRELRDDIIKAFGGEKSEIGKLWKDYSVKQSILENMDAIVSTYKTKPTQTVTAKNRLMAIFDENKPEFLKAVRDIEKEMGVDIIGDVASTKFSKILPEGILKADGGLPTKSGIIDKLIKALFIPVTSPKLAVKLAGSSKRSVGAIEQRLLGDYSENLSKSKNMPIATQDNMINTPIAPKINNNVDNIPESITPANKLSTVSKIKKFIGNDLPNKQGGFVRIGKDTKKTVTPESVGKKMTFEDREEALRYIKSKPTLNNELMFNDYFEKHGIQNLSDKDKKAFLQEAVDYATEKAKGFLPKPKTVLPKKEGVFKKGIENIEIGGEIYKNGDVFFDGNKKIGVVKIDGNEIVAIKSFETGGGKKIVDKLLSQKDFYYVRSVPEAKGFWEKMGIKDFKMNNDSGLYEGYLKKGTQPKSILPKSKVNESVSLSNNSTKK